MKEHEKEEFIHRVACSVKTMEQMTSCMNWATNLYFNNKTISKTMLEEVRHILEVRFIDISRNKSRSDKHGRA